ncbi:hypothetical protein BD413DRAFT_613609 [Trametes elegans]|nr:hypothetical protein BD413DRAFT_613609 [Trametes elegans]
MADTSVVDEWIQVNTTVIVQKSSIAAVFVLMLYEFMLTFDREVDLFWTPAFTRSTVLFMLNRYITLLKYPVTMTGYMDVPDAEYVPYDLLGPRQTLEIIPYLVWAVFSAMRVHALTGRDWRLASVVFVLLSSYVKRRFLSQYLFVMSVPENPGYPFSCEGVAVIPDVVNIAARPNSDTYHVWRMTVQAQINVKLSKLILRDGSIYFAVLLSINGLHIVSVLATPFTGSISIFEEPLTAIIISRIMLNLREADQSNRQISSVQSDVQFRAQTTTIRGDYVGRGASVPFDTHVPKLGNGLSARVYSSMGTVTLDEIMSAYYPSRQEGTDGV